MGFALNCGPMANFTAPADRPLLRAFLAEHRIYFTEDIAYTAFVNDRFFEAGEPGEADPDEIPEDDPEVDPGAGYLATLETGWSWWSNTQDLAEQLLGPHQSPNIQNIHAWYGVAVPGEITPTTLGISEPILPPDPPQQGLLQKLGFGKPAEPDVETLVKTMTSIYSGGEGALHVVSAPGLVRELGRLLEALGAINLDPLALFEELEDDDPAETGKLMALLAYRFIKTTSERGYLVWFVK